MTMRYFCLLLVSILPLLAKAESADWVIAPKYSYIEPYAKDLFKVKTGGKVGLIDNNGKEIVPITADSITNPVEGYALILNLEKDKLRLVGLINSYGAVKKIKQEWYVDDYPFFSEGKLPVCTRKGKYGFIDTDGNLVIKCEYGAVHPFCEGFSAVSKSKSILNAAINLLGGNKKDKMFYINAQGLQLDLQSDIDDIYLATSFRKGKAFVISMENKRCYIDTSGRLLSIEAETTPLQFDSKHALISGNDKGYVVESTTYKPTVNGPIPFLSKGLYGYKAKSKTILPAQFIYAAPFSDGCAVAKSVYGYGVLKLTQGTFECRQESKSASANGQEDIVYAVNVPNEWKDATFTMTCINSNGTESTFKSSGTNGNLLFEATVPDGRKTFSLEGVSNGNSLVVWRSATLLSEDNNSLLKVTVSADETSSNGTADVDITFTNNGNEAITFSAGVSGDNVMPANSEVSIDRGMSKKLTTKITGIDRSAIVTVMITADGESISRDVIVHPYKAKPARRSKPAKKKKAKQKGEFA